jgi:hypothetical protein
MAAMPARTTLGNSRQASTTTAKSRSLGSRLVALSVARAGRGPTFAVAPRLSPGVPLCDATLLQSARLGVF